MADTDSKTTKKIKPGSIEADPDELAIVVNYDVEVRGIGDYGETVILERKKDKKKIKLKTLTAQSNIQALAEQIVDKCKLIPASKIPLVETLLYQLQKRSMMDEVSRASEGDREVEGYLRGEKRGKEAHRDRERDQEEPTEQASIADLDDYIENLYDDMEKKVKGTSMILQLARSAANLEHLIQNDVLLGALSRTLREDGKRSMELVINIVTVFHIFSTFSQFHPLIMQYQIGDIVMKIIALEIQRHQIRVQGLNEKANTTTTKRDKSPNPITKKADDDEKEAKKLLLMQKKQDKLLYVCYFLLLNLAEDIGIEQKMRKRNLVKYLVGMLDRRNPELLALVMSFLKKLSIFQENKSEMMEAKIIEKLERFTPCGNDMLMGAALRLLFNLSFDSAVREDMVKSGMVIKLVDMLKRPASRGITLRLLYHLSMDDKCKSLFTFTDAIQMILQMLINFPEPIIGKELVALAVNLVHNQRNAEMLMERDGLKLLMSRVLRTRDAMLMKVIRTCAQHDIAGRKAFLDYLPDLVKLCVATDNNDLLVEVMGLLACLPIESFSSLMVQNRILDFLQKFLVLGYAEDDIVLEVIIFIGNIAGDPACAPYLCRTKILGCMYQLITEKQEDDEIVLQILYAFHRLIFHKEIRDVLLGQTQLANYLVDLLLDKNKDIASLADMTLDVILDFNTDPNLVKRVRQRKFQAHNQQWLEIIEDDAEAEEQQDLRYGQAAAMRLESSPPGSSTKGSSRTSLQVGAGAQVYSNGVSGGAPQSPLSDYDDSSLQNSPWPQRNDYAEGLGPEDDDNEDG
eukprot:CAMPEP_0184665670 /NCGR_PEP_ID=MMETSP0308-20130426/58158_1 /TAXON_ID=38269 /ORGANISM="Gloeochaete witrockiana, Strain SAG 46.84" /LENGTH=798 /DNA_ID=CAMNT_0027109807 /DNA_START=91 /DNA_END=2487 /DNA_ORIENTATION=+